MLEPSNEQREAIIRLMAEVWGDFVSDTGCFPDDFTILPRRRLQFVAGSWSGMVADALYALDGPIATALAEARAEGRRQGLEEAAKAADAAFLEHPERTTRGIYGETLARLRSLATNTPETGESR